MDIARHFALKCREHGKHAAFIDERFERFCQHFIFVVAAQFFVKILIDLIAQHPYSSSNFS